MGGLPAIEIGLDLTPVVDAAVQKAADLALDEVALMAA